MSTPNQRITIYLSEDQLDLAERLQDRFAQEYAPDMRISRSSWLNILLNRGAEAMREELLEQN